MLLPRLRIPLHIIRIPFLGSVVVVFLMCATPSRATDLEITPSRVDMGDIQYGVERIDSVLLTNTSIGDSIVIERIGLPRFGVRLLSPLVPVQLTSQTSLYLRFAILCNVVDCFDDTLTIYTRLDSFAIPISFCARRSVQGLVVTPEAIDYGTVFVGTRYDRTVTLKNTGTDTLNIIDTRLPGASEYRLISGFPSRIEPDSTSSFSFEFMPRDTGCTTRGIVIISDAGRSLVVLRSCATTQSHSVDDWIPYRLDMADVYVGNCTDEGIDVSNPRRQFVTLFGIYSDDPDAAYITSTLTIPVEGVELPFDDVVALPFRFCPTEPRNYRASFRCVTDSGVFAVDVFGRGLQIPKPQPRKFYLLPAHAHVGKVFRMTLVADPPLTPEDRVSRLSVNVQAEPSALILDNILAGESISGASLNLENVMRDGRNGMYSADLVSSSGAIEGTELMYFDFTGLSTGQPQDSVGLSGRIAVETGQTDSSATFNGGNVFLEGCTLGASRFSKRVTVSRLAIGSSGNDVVLLYTAPDGVVGTYDLIDVSGSTVIHRSTPPGSGTEQELRLSLDRFPAGLYGLRVRFGDDQVIVPFVRPQ